METNIFKYFPKTDENINTLLLYYKLRNISEHIKHAYIMES